MIRLAECVLGEVQKRGCLPLETFLLGLRLKFWPIFQNIMNGQVENLKRMADNAGTAGFLSGRTGVRDETIHKVRTSFSLYNLIVHHEKKGSATIRSDLCFVRLFNGE